MHKNDDLISRQAAIDALHMDLMYRMGTDSNKKRLDDWINSLPSAQETHEERTEERTKTHACDLIDRQAAIDAMNTRLEDIKLTWRGKVKKGEIAMYLDMRGVIETFPSAQSEIIRCSECKFSKCIEPNDDWYECQHDKRVNHSNGYCNWAERREK